MCCRFWSLRQAVWGIVSIWTLHGRPLPGSHDACCSLFSVPGPLQTVQRAEVWSMVLAVQADTAGDNLNVVRNVSHLIDGFVWPRPLEPKEDGDLSVYISCVLELRGQGTVKPTKVKGHADDEMGLLGTVRSLDKELMLLIVVVGMFRAYSGCPSAF